MFSDWVKTLQEGVAVNMHDPNPNARLIKVRTAAAASLSTTVAGCAFLNTRTSSSIRILLKLALN